MKHKKIFFLQDKKAARPNLTVKVLKQMHLNMNHGIFADMSAECKRLGGMRNKIDVRILISIQECIACTHRR